MVERPNSAAAMDIASHLHPYTNARRHEAEGPMVITEGKGIYVYDDQGKEYIEGLAGLWSTALGFGEERLVQAAAEQMRKLPYYHSFAHKAPMPTIELAAKLLEIAPVPMSKVFFANSGSEANDTVIKMVWYYNNALGRPDKKKIISRIKGYHGVTVATASLTGLPYNQRDFDLPIANILHTSCPHHYRFGQNGENEEDFATRCAAELEQLILDEGPETIAAFIGEPVMGAGGVIVPPRTYWAKVQAVLEKYDVLLIVDEVICGFGRTGNLFGCQTYGIKPDIMTVAKALSSSYLPISAVLISDPVYQTIADNSAKIGTFGHGYTYSGHPVPAAVALETLKIYEERDIVGHVRQVGPRLQEGLGRYADHPMVGEVRGVGLIAAVELVADEVICGFGRTGNLFGCQTFNIKPDIITMAKALSSGYLPISAVLISDPVYQTIADNTAKIGTFGHGFTYSGHPVPAAVALETLKIYEERDIVGHVRQVGPRLQEGLRRYADHPMVGEVRGVGLIAGVELVADRASKATFDPPGRVGGYFAERAQAHGLIIRNLMDVIAFCPPLIITEDQIDSLVERFARALDDTASWVEHEGLASVA